MKKHLYFILAIILCSSCSQKEHEEISEETFDVNIGVSLSNPLIIEPISNNSGQTYTRTNTEQNPKDANYDRIEAIFFNLTTGKKTTFKSEYYTNNDQLNEKFGAIDLKLERGSYKGIIALHKWLSRNIFIPYQSFENTDTFESTLMTNGTFPLGDIQYATIDFEVNASTTLQIQTQRIASLLSVGETDLPTNVKGVKYEIKNCISRFSPSQNKPIESYKQDVIFLYGITKSDISSKAIFSTTKNEKLSINIYLSDTDIYSSIPTQTVNNVDLNKNQKLILSANEVLKPKDGVVNIDIDQTPWEDMEIPF